MEWLIPAISIDCGFKLAVALILFVRYYETKDKVIFWWAMGWFFFGLHTTTELTIIFTKFEPLWFVRHIVWAFTAVAFIESVGYMRRPTAKIWHIASAIVGVGAIIGSYLGVFVLKDWYTAAIPTSFLNGLGFIGCAFYFLKFTKDKKSPARLPIFLGFFLNGVHNLDYPFLRPVVWFAPIGFSLGVVFSLIFAIGLIMMSTEELKRQKDESQHVARNLSILNAISIMVSKSLHLEEILKDVLDRVLKVMKIDCGCIFSLNEEAKELNLKVYRGFSDGYLHQITKLKLDQETIYTKVARTGKPAIIYNISEYPEFKTPAVEKEGLRSFGCIPLKSKEKIVGVLSISSHMYHRITPQEFQLLNSIGGIIGVAIENARLYETVKGWSKELEEVAEERTKDLTDARRATLNILEDINEAYRELKETQDQLVQRERLATVGRMAAIVSHELKNTLMNINTTVYYLRSKLKDKTPAYEKSMNDMGQEIERMSKIISNILEFSRPPKLVFSLTDINSILHEVLTQEQFAQDIKLRKIEVVENLSAAIPKISLDAFRLKQALNNLILNALEAISIGGKLIVKTDVIDKELEIRITDTGQGIPEENLERIFEPFFSTKSKGMGLGLAIVKEIVTAHQGKIWAESELEKGSSFIIRLPFNRKGDVEL